MRFEREGVKGWTKEKKGKGRQREGQFKRERKREDAISRVLIECYG